MATTTQTSTWQTKASQHKASATAKIPKEWILDPKWTNDINQTSNQNVIDIPRKSGLLTDREVDLTENYDAVALLQKLSRGELSATELTTAFSKRAAIAHQLTNCLTEIFFDQGLERAEFLDEYLVKNKKPLGPLHGLPISIKDSFKVNGLHSTIGYVSFIDHGPDSEESALVKILLDLGAVLYVKTNIPQSLMTADSDNNVFGAYLRRFKVIL
jgi:amidase